jgi:hypothetical protein
VGAISDCPPGQSKIGDFAPTSAQINSEKWTERRIRSQEVQCQNLKSIGDGGVVLLMAGVFGVAVGEDCSTADASEWFCGIAP